MDHAEITSMAMDSIVTDLQCGQHLAGAEAHLLRLAICARLSCNEDLALAARQALELLRACPAATWPDQVRKVMQSHPSSPIYNAEEFGEEEDDYFDPDGYDEIDHSDPKFVAATVKFEDGASHASDITYS